MFDAKKTRVRIDLGMKGPVTVEHAYNQADRHTHIW